MKGSFEYARYDGGNLVIVDLCDDGGAWNTPDVCDGEYEYDADKRILTISYRCLEIHFVKHITTDEEIKLEHIKDLDGVISRRDSRIMVKYKGRECVYSGNSIKFDITRLFAKVHNFRLTAGTVLTYRIPPEKVKGGLRKEIRVLGDSTFTVVDKRQEKI